MISVAGRLRTVDSECPQTGEMSYEKVKGVVLVWVMETTLDSFLDLAHSLFFGGRGIGQRHLSVSIFLKTMTFPSNTFCCHLV